jgi:hypothetical protein
MTKRKPILKNRVEMAIAQAVVALATDQPAYGQVRVANELRRRGLTEAAAGQKSRDPTNYLARRSKAAITPRDRDMAPPTSWRGSLSPPGSPIGRWSSATVGWRVP